MAGELSVERVRANLADVRGRVDAAAARSGRAGSDVAVLAAVKYVGIADIGLLAEAGVTLVGENRAQELVAKVEVAAQLLRWHFIGQLQSRKVRLVAPRVELIHSLASLSAARALEAFVRPGLSALIEVNVAGEEGKAGVAPGDVSGLIAACPVPVVGLMTMPPAGGGEAGRQWFAELRALGERFGLAELSMGTSQDYEVAVEEGATIVRIGTSLYV